MLGGGLVKVINRLANRSSRKRSTTVKLSLSSTPVKIGAAGGMLAESQRHGKAKPMASKNPSNVIGKARSRPAGENVLAMSTR